VILGGIFLIFQDFCDSPGGIKKLCDCGTESIQGCRSPEVQNPCSHANFYKGTSEPLKPLFLILAMSKKPYKTNGFIRFSQLMLSAGFRHLSNIHWYGEPILGFSTSCSHVLNPICPAESKTENIQVLHSSQGTGFTQK